jgi:hypothetical protein
LVDWSHSTSEKTRGWKKRSRFLILFVQGLSEQSNSELWSVVFGTPLRVLAQREKDLDIPSVLHTCCQFLMEHGLYNSTSSFMLFYHVDPSTISIDWYTSCWKCVGLTVEGIFRKSGLQTEIENIKDQFDSGTSSFSSKIKSV